MRFRPIPKRKLRKLEANVPIRTLKSLLSSDADELLYKDESSDGDILTSVSGVPSWSTVTHSEPTRVIDTVYQNTSGKTRFVTITMNMFVGSAVTHHCDTDNPPTTAVASQYAPAGEAYFQTPVTFVVPDDYYYCVTTVVGSPTINRWHEWDL